MAQSPRYDLMTIDISVNVFDKSVGGVPTRNNPKRLKWLDFYSHSIADRFGFETMTCGWNATAAEVREWANANNLKRPGESYSPDGIKIWDGFLSEISIKIGSKWYVFSLKDMANNVIVHYNTDAGAQASTSAFSAAASIALFGRKDRVLDLSTVSAFAAANRAQTVLNDIAYPTSKKPTRTGTGVVNDYYRIELTFSGDYGTLDWIMTSNTSQTLTNTNVQIGSLLTSYNAINNWFSTSTNNIIATGVPDTEFTDAETTYRDKIETLMAHGNSAKQHLSWGIYENRTMHVSVRATSSPTNITYREHESTGIITDRFNNEIKPWFLRPNAMAETVDVESTPLRDAIESPVRKFVARVTCRVDGNGYDGNLEPDNIESLEELLSSPTGAGPAGTSDRQATFERRVTAPQRTRFSGVNGRVDAGGGSIGNTGGGDIDLGTGVGIGGGGGGGGGDPITFGSGIAGRIAQWLTSARIEASTLIKSGGGVLTINATTDQTLNISGSGGTLVLGSNTLTLDGSLRISGSGASTGQTLIHDGTKFAPATLISTNISNFGEAVDDRVATLLQEGTNITLTYNDIANTLTIDATFNGVTGTGTTGRVAKWTSSTAIGADTLAKTGTGVLTFSASTSETITVASGGSGTIDLNGATLTIDSNTRIDGTGAVSGQVLKWNGTAYAPSSIVDGSGSADRVTYWSDANTLASDAAMMWDASLSRLNVDGSMMVSGNEVTNGGYFYTERDGSGIWATYATGSLWRVWNSVSGDRMNINTSGDMKLLGTVTTASNVAWDLGGVTNTGDAPSNGYVTVKIDGATVRLSKQ